MRLIDADKLDWWYKGRPIRRVIDEAPTVDAVPVVRCKDCKHRELILGEWCCGALGDVSIDDDDFCSYGERKDK
jgi:hypothetical protein